MSNFLHDDEDDVDSFLSGIINEKDKISPKKPKNTSKKRAAKSLSRFRKILYIVRRNILLKRLLTVTVLVTLLLITIAKLTPDFFANSPFEEEVRQSVDYGLYYPSTLPAGYKIETESIQKVEGGVVIYSISNEDGKRITVSSQEKPQDLDIDKIYGDFNDIYDLKTHNGDIKVGKAPNGTLVAAMTIGDTWLIINTPNRNLSVEEFNKVLVSRFKKG